MYVGLGLLDLVLTTTAVTAAASDPSSLTSMTDLCATSDTNVTTICFSKVQLSDDLPD